MRHLPIAVALLVISVLLLFAFFEPADGKRHHHSKHRHHHSHGHKHRHHHDNGKEHRRKHHHSGRHRHHHHRGPKLSAQSNPYLQQQAQESLLSIQSLMSASNGTIMDSMPSNWSSSRNESTAVDALTAELINSISLNDTESLASSLNGTNSTAILDKRPQLTSYKDISEGGKVHKIPITKEHTYELYQHWLDQAVSSIFASLANKKLRNRSKQLVQEFGKCSKAAKTVDRHAKCVSRLLRNEFHVPSATGHSSSSSSEEHRRGGKGRRRPSPQQKKLGAAKWAGEFRRDQALGRRPRRWAGDAPRRAMNVVQRSSAPELHSTSGGVITPLGSVARLIMKEVLKAKNKTREEVKPWQDTVVRLRNFAIKRKELKQKMEDGSLEEWEQFAFRGMKSKGLLPAPSDKQHMAEEITAMMDDPRKLRSWLNKKRSAKTRKPMQKMVELLRDGFKLGYSLVGKNTSDFDDKTLRIVSPRFLSILPEETQVRDKEDLVDIVSPSLFSLHNDGVGIENLTSIPNLVRGFGAKDQQEWMNLILEAAGIMEEVDKLEGEMTADEMRRNGTLRVPHYDLKRYEKEIRAKDGTPLYFTKKNVTEMLGSYEERKIDTIESLDRSLSKAQLREMNATGYAFMTREQLHQVYGAHSPYNNSEALHRLSNLTAAQMHAGLEIDIHNAAQARQGEAFRIPRQRDTVLSPIAFTYLVGLPSSGNNAIILSPIFFSPIVLSPTVFGPLVLSPLVFSPVILSPNVLGPVLLSPLIFVPIILTPLALHPFILSPGALNVLILSPFVLTPVIMSPQVLTPIILSPFALSPFILQPTVASPLILSPFVLSPAILSPAAFSATILSPYALSPVLYSPVYAYSVILSPSWLS